MKSQQNNWDDEDDLEMLNPAQPKRNCKIVVFGRMVNDMCGPEESVIVRHTMGPVTTKIKH
jgi:hypothetical protein